MLFNRRLANDAGFREHIQNMFASRIATYSTTIKFECELTTKCMNDCDYCGADIYDQQGEVDFDVVTKHIINYSNYAKENNLTLSTDLIGGDPMLYSQFNRLVEFLHEHNLPYFVKTNASTLTHARIELLKATGCRAIKLTCYGEEEMHNAHRGLDTFQLLVDRTKMAQSYDVPVVWHLSVGKENLESVRKVLPTVIDMKLAGVTEGRIGKFGLLSKVAHFEQIEPHEWRRFLLEVLHLYYQHGRKGFNLVFRDKLWVALLCEEGLLDLEPFRGKGISLGCDMFSYMATVDFRGYLKGCGLMESAQKQVTFYPNPKSSKIYFSKDTAKLPSTSTCAKCSFYDFCRGCRAIAKGNTGDINAQDPQCWRGR